MTKLDASGATLGYSTYLGGSALDGGEYGSAITLDGAGNVFVTGETGSSDFPTTAGAFDTTFGFPADAFVTKVDASGATLGYSTYLGGDGNDHGDGIAVDGADSAYATGQTDATDFPTTAGAFDRTLGGDVDVFVTKFDASGAALGYSTYLGGSDAEGFYNGDIAVGAAGDAYVTGFTISTDFPTTPGAFDTTLGGPSDAFMTKLDASGAALGYSTYLGGDSLDYGSSVAVDGVGNAYVTGATHSMDFPTSTGAFDHDLQRRRRCFRDEARPRGPATPTAATSATAAATSAAAAATAAATATASASTATTSATATATASAPTTSARRCALPGAEGDRTHA